MPALRATKQPWYRVDVFRRCKTGEVIEATPRTLAQKLCIAAVGLFIGAPVLFGSQWFFRTWIPRYYAELDAFAKIDPVASAHRLAEFISLLFLVPVLACIAVAIAATVQAGRIVRAGRRPLPGATVRRRTEVVAGWWCVRFPTLIWGLVILGCAFCAWWSYVQLTAMFWNGYLDKRIEVSSKTSLRTAAPKPALAPDLNAIGVKP